MGTWVLINARWYKTLFALLAGYLVTLLAQSRKRSAHRMGLPAGSLLNLGDGGAAGTAEKPDYGLLA